MEIINRRENYRADGGKVVVYEHNQKKKKKRKRRSREDEGGFSWQPLPQQEMACVGKVFDDEFPPFSFYLLCGSTLGEKQPQFFSGNERTAINFNSPLPSSASEKEEKALAVIQKRSRFFFFSFYTR